MRSGNRAPRSRIIWSSRLTAVSSICSGDGIVCECWSAIFDPAPFCATISVWVAAPPGATRLQSPGSTCNSPFSWLWRKCAATSSVFSGETEENSCDFLSELNMKILKHKLEYPGGSFCTFTLRHLQLFFSRCGEAINWTRSPKLSTSNSDAGWTKGGGAGWPGKTAKPA